MYKGVPFSKIGCPGLVLAKLAHLLRDAGWCDPRECLYLADKVGLIVEIERIRYIRKSFISPGADEVQRLVYTFDADIEFWRHAYDPGKALLKLTQGDVKSFSKFMNGDCFNPLVDGSQASLHKFVPSNALRQPGNQEFAENRDSLAM